MRASREKHSQLDNDQTTATAARLLTAFMHASEEVLVIPDETRAVINPDLPQDVKDAVELGRVLMFLDTQSVEGDSRNG